MLDRLNTHGIGFVGLAIGGSSIVASVTALFKLLSDPTYLTALFAAAMHARAHTLDATDIQTFAQLIGGTFAVVGALIVAFLLTYFGMPKNIANAPDAAPASTPGSQKGPNP